MTITIPVAAIIVLTLVLYVTALSAVTFFINRKNRANRLFALYTLLIASWGLLAIFYVWLGILADRLYLVAMLVMSQTGPLFYFFCRDLSFESKPVRRWEYILPAAGAYLSIFYLACQFVPALHDYEMSIIRLEHGTMTQAGVHAHFILRSMVLAAGHVGGFVLLFLGLRRQADRRLAGLIRNVLISGIFGFTGGWLFNNLLPMAGLGSMTELSVVPIALGFTFVTFSLARNRAWTVEYLLDKVRESEAKLAESYDKLRELDRIKSDFFSNVSHELRTPLTLIVGPMEGLLENRYGALQSSVRESVEIIHKNALRLLNLINELLDFSKIDAGRMELKRERTDLGSLVSFYLSLVRSALDIRKIRLEYSSGEAGLPVDMDRKQFEKIFFNLVSNAIKFTPDGGTIAVRLSRDGDRVVLSMTDTGSGIAPELLDRIFDKFTSFADRQQGTGIGMALVKELVELHGGTISVASTPGSGTAFTLSFPAAGDAGQAAAGELFVYDATLLGKVDASDNKTAASLTAPPAAATDNAVRILIADDTADMREYLVSLLSGEFSVAAAVNGREALDMVPSFNPDLVISDVMMPEMNGYELVRRLKTGDSTRNIPVILLTAKADLDYKVQGLEFGADDYLGKPFEYRELIARVHSLLKIREYQLALFERNAAIEMELDLARLIQKNLVPETMPSAPGFSFGAAYLPMDKVGGDFFDLLCRDGKLYFMITDVSGHGIPGALLSTIVKIIFDHHAVTAATAADFIKALDDCISRRSVKSMFATSAFGIITNDGTLNYCNAGHCLPLVCNRSGEIVELQKKNPAAGFGMNVNFRDDTYRLLSGDRLVLYTDGVVESFNGALEMFGEERLYGVIRRCVALGPQEFVDELKKAVIDFAGSESLQDDVTIVAIDFA